MAEQGVVLRERDEVALEEIRVAEPGPGEVRVRIDATGVCHSDLHVIEEDGWGHPYPVLLGHEGAGTVESVGAAVEGVQPGDRVVVAWKTACGECEPCRRGELRQCKRPPAAPGRLLRAGGEELTPVLRTGTFATHTVVPQQAVVPVPRALPPEQACLIGCAVATGVMSVLETAKVWEGARVAVIGCGAVGLSAVQGARIAGASEIRALDLDEAKAEQARRFGATHTDSGPVDFVFDAVARRQTFDAGLRMLASGGTYVLIGLSPAGERAEVDLPRLFAKRARILVSHGGDHLPQEDFPKLAQWALDGKLDLASMVTRTAGLDGWRDAFEGDEERRRDPHRARPVTPLEGFRAIIAGEREPPPVARLLGFRMLEADEGRVVFELEARPEHESPLGTLHGGVICDVANAALGCAHASLLGDGETFTTLELKVNFMKPVWAGATLRAEGKVLKAGRTVGLAECRVTDDGGSLVAYATSTLMTLRGEAADGR